MNSLNNSTPNLPSISIIMVSFNQLKMIEKSINSVLTQNYPELEFIIIDGGSTDGSIEIIKKYSQYNKTKVIIEPDKGMYHARNKGLMLATGDYIGFLNTDDILFPEAIRDVGEIILKENYPDMIYGYTMGLSKDGNALENIIFGPNLNLLKGEYFKRMKTIPDQSTFYKRSAFSLIGLYDTSLRFGADTDLKCRFIINEMKISRLPKIIAGWRIYEEALTHRPDLKRSRFKEAIRVNHKYTNSYINYYTIRLFVYNFIVPKLKRIITLSNTIKKLLISRGEIIKKKFTKMS